MVFARIGHGSCYYHWNAVFAGVKCYIENTLKIVEIPESEELIIPEPQGMQNLYHIPDDSEIKANTPRAEIMKMEIAGTKIETFSIHCNNFTNFEN